MAHLQTITHVYEEWERGNYRAGLDLYAPDMTLEVHSPIPDAAVYEGLAGLQGYMRSFLGMWQDYWIRGAGFEQDGDRVSVQVRHGGQAGGARVESHFTAIWTFRDERVVRVDVLQDDRD